MFLACAIAVAVLSAAGPAGATEYTYTFNGQVTALDNPSGFFTAPAAVGAPVSGSFTYSDTPTNPPFQLNPNFTNYSTLTAPRTTQIVLNVGGAEARSSSNSLSNMIVGNDNAAEPFSPFFPAGDSFRYQDGLSDASPLFDFAAADFAQFANGLVSLTDPTGAALGSQTLPAGLPLSELTNRTGLIYIEDDNFEETGRLVFRIDSIQLVPEPTSLSLLAAAGLGLTLRRRQRRATNAA